MNLQILECERLPFLGQKCPFFVDLGTVHFCRFEMTDNFAPVKEFTRFKKSNNFDTNIAVLKKEQKISELGTCMKPNCPLVGKIITGWELIDV